MGIEMQIMYLGFAGSAQIEAEAAAQLVRIERFSKSIAGCHLAIEAIHGLTPGATSDHPMFDVRLDLLLRTGEFVPLEHRQSTDPDDAVRAAFDVAERLLEGGAALQRTDAGDSAHF